MEARTKPSLEELLFGTPTLTADSRSVSISYHLTIVHSQEKPIIHTPSAKKKSTCVLSLGKKRGANIYLPRSSHSHKSVCCVWIMCGCACALALRLFRFSDVNDVLTIKSVCRERVARAAARSFIHKSRVCVCVKKTFPFFFLFEKTVILLNRRRAYKLSIVEQ